MVLGFVQQVLLPTEPSHLPHAAHLSCGQATPTAVVISAVGHLSEGAHCRYWGVSVRSRPWGIFVELSHAFLP